MPGLSDLLRNPRRLRQFAETPGNYQAALEYANQDQPQSRVGRRPSSRASSSSSSQEPETLETGTYIEQVKLPDGSLVRPATESGRLVKAPGKSNIYLDPANGEPYAADPSQPTGLRSAWQNATRKTRDGKVVASIPGVGERELGVDPKVAEDAAKAAAKRDAENRRLALAREKRPYNIDRVTGEPVPLQTDEEWAAVKQAKVAKLDESARVKRLKDQADVIDLEAERVNLTSPKPAKEDEEAFTAAEAALLPFAARQNVEDVAVKFAGAPAVDEASTQAKAAAENYLAYKDKVKPAKEAEKKVKELKLRALDIKEQIINPQKWKEGKTASLAVLKDDELVAEVKAQADIINEQEEKAVSTLDGITKGRNEIVKELNDFNAERQRQNSAGMTAEEMQAADATQNQMEQALTDYDEWNSEAKAESDAALKAAADRRDVLAVAGTELDSRIVKQKESFQQAKAKADTMAKAKPLYEEWAKGLYSEDWRTEEETPRFAEEAAKVGLSLPEAKEALQTYRQLDWSNVRRDPKTGETIKEDSRTTPSGDVTVTPVMWGDAETYNKAVEASQGTPEGKAKAIKTFPKLQEIYAEKAVEILSQSASIPGADNFMAWRERKITEDQATQGKLGFARQTPARQAITYMEEMKNRSWFRKAGEQVGMNLIAGFQDIATQALGVGAMVTGSETLSDLAAANARNTQSVVGAQSLEGSDTDYALRVMGLGARMAPAVAAMVTGAGAVGGGLTTAAVLAGTQTAGSMFADLYKTAKDKGVGHGEAWQEAVVPAVLSGTVTSLLTAGFGATGLERIFVDKAAENVARNTFKSMLIQFAKGAGEEMPEEIADEYFSTIIQAAFASEDPVATLKEFAKSLPELAGATALMGGAGALMQARRQASQKSGMAPLPEDGVAPMPVQPRPAGPAPAPTAATISTEERPSISKTGLKKAAFERMAALREKRDGKFTLDKDGNSQQETIGSILTPTEEKTLKLLEDTIDSEDDVDVEALAKAFGYTLKETIVVDNKPAPPPPATAQDVAEQIAQFNPTGATPLPQSVTATAKRTGRPTAAVARQAASGAVKIAQGQSIDQLDIEEQEALGFVNKDGKIAPADNKVTPLVYDYKGKPVIRNAAAEWLTDEAQEGLAGMVNLTEAERKAQIDAEEAAAKAPAAKKKAGQAAPAKAESTPQGSEVVITGGSLPSNTGANPVPATIPTPANEPQPQTAVSQKPQVRQDMPKPRELSVLPEQPPTPPQEAPTTGRPAPKYPIGKGATIFAYVYRSEGDVTLVGDPIWNATDKAWEYPAMTNGGRSFNVAERFVTRVTSTPTSQPTPSPAQASPAEAAPSPSPASQPAGQATAFKAGDFVRANGKGPVFKIESIGDDGYVYLANGQGSYSAEDAAKILVQSTEDAATNEAAKGGFPGFDKSDAATPEGRAEAALAEYEAKVRESLVRNLSKAERDLAGRKLDLAARLRARLRAMTGSVEYDVYSTELRAKSGELEVQPVGEKGSILFINPEKLINRLTAKHKTVEAAREGMDTFILHEFIHKAAIGNMNATKIIGLYNLLTPEAKAASKALYLSDSGLTDFQQKSAADKEFAAAHEWFAQLVEARLRGKISNQAEIEASQDPAFRNKLIALLKDFVAQLRDIAKLVTDKAQAARIEAEADAVQAIVADMAAKAGLELGRAEAKPASPASFIEDYTNDDIESIIKRDNEILKRIGANKTVELPNGLNLSMSKPTSHKAMRDPNYDGDYKSVVWVVYDGNAAVASGHIELDEEEEGDEYFWERGAYVSKKHQRSGIYTSVLRALNKEFGEIAPDTQRTKANANLWEKNFPKGLGPTPAPPAGPEVARQADSPVGQINTRPLEEAERNARKRLENLQYPSVGGGKSADKVDKLRKEYAQEKAARQADLDAASAKLKAAYAQNEALPAGQADSSAGAEVTTPQRDAVDEELAKAFDGLAVPPRRSATPEDAEYIAAAALKDPRTGKIFKGATHGYANPRDRSQLNLGLADDSQEYIGYVTNTGRWVSQEEAENRWGVYGSESSAAYWANPLIHDAAVGRGYEGDRFIDPITETEYQQELKRRQDSEAAHSKNSILRTPQDADTQRQSLGAPPTQPIEQVALPKERREAMLKAASNIVDLGLTESADLAARLDKLAANGSLRKYARSFWRLMTGFNADLQESPDWQAVFANIDATAQPTEATIAEADLTPPQAAAIAKEEAMPEPAKQAAPFDAVAAKGQKKFLLAEVAAAVKAAPRRADMPEDIRDALNEIDAIVKKFANQERDPLPADNAAKLSREIKELSEKVRAAVGTITIQVPGDGTFTILNEKGALAQFQKRADKFPTTQTKDDMPARPTAQAPTSVPALKKPKTTADVVAAIYPMVSSDETRGLMTTVKGDGTNLWATNGRILVKVVQENGGGTGADNVSYDEKGNAQPWPVEKGNYNGEAIIPTDERVKPYTIDTGRWFGLMSQARAVIKELPGETNTASKAVSLYRNSDGSLGVFASDVNRGDYAHNIQPEAKILAAYDPEYFQTILRVARSLGNEQIEFRIYDDISPATFRTGNATFVIMPMRVNGAPAYSTARPAPPVTAETSPAAQAPAQAPASQVPAVSQPSTPEAGKVEAKPGIADFGEKILGARKDLWGKYKRIIEQDLPDSMEDVTLAKNVPEPDYEAAIANGVPVEALAVLKAIRDVIPPKPKKMYKLKSWGEAVKFLHKLTQDTLASKSLDPSLLTALEKTSRISGLAGKIALYQRLGYPLFTKAKPWTIGNWDVGHFKGQKLDNYTPATVASKDDRSTDMLVLRTGKDAFNEVADMIKAQLQKEAESPAPNKSKTKEIPFNIYRDRFTNDHFIGRKGINGVVRLKAGFSDVKAARQYLADNKQTLEEQWEGMKIKPDYRRTVNQPRQGPERREGDVTPEMFQSTFGFRGVQFGNWVEGDRRQTDLNQAFDALIDLAEILGVPPKAMSLDGSLGLAFGARGTAGAKAHYEPGEVVINLTKETGPGSLAHEWFHAFDNYFARLDTTGETKARSLDKFATSNKKPAQDKMRPAVWEAFKRIRTVLDKGTFAARSKSLDDARSKPYYSTLVEKAARAFEQYTVDRLAGKEIANDYLVNLVKDESPALPTQAEMDNDGIRAAYDNLFNVLDAVDTDTGVRLQLPPADKGQPAGLGLPPSGVTESQFNNKLDELQTLNLEDNQFTMPKFNAAKDKFVDTLVTGEAHLMVRGKDEVSPYGAHELFIVDNDDMPIGFARLTKNPKQVSINMIHVDEDYRGRGIGSEFYRYWLDKSVSIKSDKEITDGTVAIYQKLAREGYGMAIQDGRAVLLPEAQPALALPPQSQASVGQAVNEAFVKKVQGSVQAGRPVGTSNPTTASKTGEGTDSAHNVELDRLRKNNPLAYRQNALILTRYPVVAKKYRALHSALAKADAPVIAAKEEVKKAKAALAAAQKGIKDRVASLRGMKTAQVKASLVNEFIAANLTARAVKAKDVAQANLDKANAKAAKAADYQSKAISEILDGNAIPEDMAAQIYEDYITAVESNLLTLIKLFPKRLRDVARLWYDGANIIAQKFGKQYKATLEQASGVLAVFSPQKDWFMNVSLAQRMMNIWANDQKTVWSPEMTKQFIMRSGEPQPVESIKKGDTEPTISTRESLITDANPEGIVYQHGAIKKVDDDGNTYWENWDNKKAADNLKDAQLMLKHLEGKTLSQIKLSKHKARFIRILSEVRDSSAYPIVTPDGRMPGTMQVNNDKVTLSKVAWGGYNTIEKAIAIMSATPENEHTVISTALGDQHKVRSFYNNIVDPANKSGHVTMDTHAIAAIHWMPHSGSSLEVTQNFGGGGVKNDGIAGIKGTYAANAEAYRRAAVVFEMLPREVQSITWEAVRLLFPKEFKTKGNIDKVRAIWNRYLHGDIDIETARAEIFTFATTSKDFPQGKDIAGSIKDGKGLGDTAWAADMGVGIDNSGGRGGSDDSGTLPKRGGPRRPDSGGGAGRPSGNGGGRNPTAMVRPTALLRRGRVGKPSLSLPPAAQAVTPFYSKLARVVAEKMPNRADVATIKGVISNPQTGIKAEELKWSGIMPWLDGQAGPIAKQAVLDYLAADGAVRLEEVTHGYSPNPNEAKARELNDLRSEYNASLGAERPEYLSASEWADELSAQEKEIKAREKELVLVGGYRPAPEAKFAQYQLPGGENYREVVLAMPEKVTSDSGLGKPTRIKIKDSETYFEDDGAYVLKYPVGGEILVKDDGRFYVITGNTEYYGNNLQAAENLLVSYLNDDGLNVKGRGYTSSHFQDVPNYVAHARLNDRTDAEGKAGTFIEEIQSDRHQDGREKGYRGDNVKTEEQLASEGLKIEFQKAGQRYVIRDEFGNSFGEGSTKQAALIDFSKVRDTKAIADAPFRSTWPIQMFKRALAEAVADNKQWIGWTTADTQFERWGSERFDWKKRTDATERRDKTWTMAAMEQTGGNAGGINIEQVARERGQLLEEKGTLVSTKADVLALVKRNLREGKAEAIAEKIWNRMQTEDEGTTMPRKEGMESFYDSKGDFGGLVKEIGKYVKQWGAGVVKGKIQTKDAVFTNFGENLIRIVDSDGTLLASYDQRDESKRRELAQRWIDYNRHIYPNARIEDGVNTAGKAKVSAIWRVDITPAMAASVGQGQSLFAPPASKGGPAASVPTQITRNMRKQLSNRGYTKEQIYKMKFAEAQAILNPAAEAEPELEAEEAGQTDADMEAFIAEQQAIAEEEAAARETLRNDPDAIDAVQASGKMSGRNLSKQFEYPEARAVYQALTVARDQLGGPEIVQLDKLREWAKKTFESDPEKYVQWAADMAEENKLLDVDEQAVLGQAFQFLTREARLTGNKNIRVLLNKVGNYYLDTGTRLAQALSARRDPLEGPHERWVKALDIVFGPSEAVRRKLRILPTEAGKARRIASLEAELAEARGSRRADVEAALNTARNQQTKEELLEKDDAKSEKIKQTVLKNIGVTEDDLMFSGTDRVALQSAVLDLPAVKAGLEAYKGKDNDGYNIMRLAFRGFSDEHIANALNLNQDDVGQFIQDATNAIIRPAVAEQVKAGSGFGGLIKAGFARLKKAVGLGLPPRQAGQVVLDKEYMDAVEAGDMAKAQAMVDEAAKAAGYEIKAYRGQAKGTTALSLNDESGNFENGVVWATTLPRMAKTYNRNVDSVWVKTGNARIEQARGASKMQYGFIDPVIEAQNEGKDSVIFKNTRDLPDDIEERLDDKRLRERFTGDVIAVFNPSQIKSADPVTRDESGQVIPLSQRFNPQSDSILRLPPKPIEAQPALLGGKRQTVADVTGEVNRVMAYALQSAKARNSGKLMSKVVMTPGGQRVRVFVPFDPDDMANYYAFAREYTAAKASAFDKVYEYWINWPLLSGPQTQVANITGNAAQVAWHYTGQRLAEATLNLAYQDPKSAQFREFKHVLKGFWQGIGPAFDMARQTFLTEGDTIRHKYLGQPLEIDVVDGDLDKVGNIRASVGGQAGRINRLPGRVLRFTDAFFKTAIMYAEASAVAYRRAHVAAKAQGLKGQARATFIDTEIANTLNDTSSAVWADVMKTAEDLLFQGNNSATEFVDTVLGGYKGIKDLEKLLAEAEAKGDTDAVAELEKRIRTRKFIGSLMRWIFPFQRTPTNIIRTGIKKAGGSAISLLYGLTMAGWRKSKDGTDFIKSYPKAMQIKDASETLLAGLGWLALASMLEGDDNDDEKPVLLVGTRSHSLKERAATDQFLRKYGGENSIVWQDGKGKVLGSLPFGRYEPAATMLTTWIDAYRNYQEVKRLKSQGENASYSTYMLSSLVSSLEDKSFLQGFANVMQFVRDVEEKRENPDQSAGTKMLMNNIIPNFIKQPLRNMDEVLRERTTAGPGYAALPNPVVAPKLPVFAAQPKISTTGERMPKAFVPAARLLFQANTKVTPQADALLYRANRLNPTKRWSPQPLNRDDYTANPPGKAKPVPITDPAKRRQFAELAGRLYATKAAQVAAKAMPSEKITPGESLIKAFKKAREDAMAAARAQAHAIGLHKPTITP